MAYSVDFRKKVLAAYINKEDTNQGLADRFKISISTVKRISQRYRVTGNVELYLDRIGHTSKIDNQSKEIIKAVIAKKPDVTLAEIRQSLKYRCGIDVTIQAIHYLLKSLGITYKKKSVYAIQRDREDIKKKREEYIETVSDKPLEQLIFLDESGANLAMSRSYGRIESGKRLVYGCPYARGSKYSIISAIGISEVTAALYTEGNVDGEIFLHFLSKLLAPKLISGQLVILDNVSFHKVKGVKEIIESVGAQVIYLPAYSPELSPIEHMWSKIKACLRKLEARCKNSFKQAIHTAFSSVQKNDLLGWYKNCGY